MKKYFSFILASLIVASGAIAQKKSDESSDQISKSFSVQKGGTLRVDVDPGAIRIEPWSKDEVLVEAEGIDERHPERLVITQSGNTVTVKYRESRRHDNDVQFIINVPSQFNADLHTTGGSVTQKDVLKGSFTAETQGGSIKMDHIIGNVNAETGGGSIRADKIEGDATKTNRGISFREMLAASPTHAVAECRFRISAWSATRFKLLSSRRACFCRSSLASSFLPSMPCPF